MMWPSLLCIAWILAVFADGTPVIWLHTAGLSPACQSDLGDSLCPGSRKPNAWLIKNNECTEIILVPEVAVVVEERKQRPRGGRLEPHEPNSRIRFCCLAGTNGKG